MCFFPGFFPSVNQLFTHFGTGKGKGKGKGKSSKAQLWGPTFSEPRDVVISLVFLDMRHMASRRGFLYCDPEGESKDLVRRYLEYCWVNDLKHVMDCNTLSSKKMVGI